MSFISQFPTAYSYFELISYTTITGQKNGRGVEFLDQKIVKTLKTKESIGDKSDCKLDTGNTADRKSSFRRNAMHASVLTD